MGGDDDEERPEEEAAHPMNVVQSYDRGGSGVAKPDVLGLPDKYAALFSNTFDVWNAHLARNRVRDRYYDGKNALKDLGISIPPSLTNIETVVGWPQKAVDSLAVRSRFDGYGGSDALNDLIEQNNFFSSYKQAVQSELIQSPAFVTVTRGGVGDPAVVLSALSSSNAAALWDYRLKRIRCGLVVSDVDDYGRPDAYLLYADDAIVAVSRHGQSTWLCDAIMPQSMGRPLMEPLVYRPTLDRPFGRSRVTRAVMSITDSAVRTALRSEIASEFFTSPQKYLLGADPELFSGGTETDETTDDAGTETKTEKPAMTKWEAYIGNILALTRDQNGDVPTVGQFPAASMQPHTEYMQSLAARFAGETSIPISSLGVVSDNPSSAEAIYAAREDLIIEAEDLNELNGRALRNVGMMALAILGNKPMSQLTDDERSIQTRFMNPARPSLVSQSDAMTKQASVFPDIVKTRVYWEELGYTHEQVDGIMTAVQASSATDTIKQMMQESKAQVAQNG